MHSTRRIVGAVISGGKVYRAGDEAALAKRMQGRSFAQLLASGTIAGAWPAPAAAPSSTSPVQLEEMVKADLVAYAATLGLTLDVKQAKAELIAAITAHRAASDPTPTGEPGSDDTPDAAPATEPATNSDAGASTSEKGGDAS